MTNADLERAVAPDAWELGRLATLDSLGLLDTPAERDFDAIVALAQRLTQSKMALVTLVDKDRQWFKAKVGLDLCETSRDVAFCAHTVAADDVLVVPDTTLDTRFASNPFVTGEPRIRFYAGYPIRAELAGSPGVRVPLGALCVIDDKPRTFGAEDVAQLGDLVHLIEALLTTRASIALASRLAEERSRNLAALSSKHRQLRQAERMAKIGSWRMTLPDHAIEWSDQTYSIHGLSVGDRRAFDAALDFYPGKAKTLISAALERTIQTGEPFDVETDFRTAQGEYRRVRSMGELELDAGRPVAVVGVFQDITARHAMEEALRQAAHTDTLTCIASRGRFNEIVDERLQSAANAHDRLALLLIDLDNFKAVNDQCGHHIGDEVLRIMASHLQAPYLSSCFAARLGGDEFVLLITDQALLQDLPGLLRRLLGDLRHTITADGVGIEISATIGACWLDHHTVTRSDLLRNADGALYAAKKRRRGSAMIAGDPCNIVREETLPALALVRP